VNKNSLVVSSNLKKSKTKKKFAFQGRAKKGGANEKKVFHRMGLHRAFSIRQGLTGPDSDFFFLCARGIKRIFSTEQSVCFDLMNHRK